jgi:lysyl-tRNA synthetase class 2
MLHARHKLLRDIREFFYSNGYIEVETPNLMKTAPPDPHIDPLEVSAGGAGPFYLHTSPEMHMKRLLRSGVDKIFQICKVYRVEEFEDVHNTEFTMLEWYRKGTYEDAMEETEELFKWCFSGSGNVFADRFDILDLEELVYSKTGINPFVLNRDSFYKLLKARSFSGIDENDDWNSLFFKLFIQEVEKTLPLDRPYFIKDWPISISTMAKSKGAGKVERFELYMDGLEIANGYTELLDSVEQKARFVRDNIEREKLGKKTFEVDEGFIDALLSLRGSYAGVSLGVDRLLMVIMGKKTIDEVLVDRLKRERQKVKGSGT